MYEKAVIQEMCEKSGDPRNVLKSNQQGSTVARFLLQGDRVRLTVPFCTVVIVIVVPYFAPLKATVTAEITALMTILEADKALIRIHNTT